eukprot:gene19051-biopygen3980
MLWERRQLQNLSRSSLDHVFKGIDSCTVHAHGMQKTLCPAYPKRPGRNGCGRVPDASHTIEFKETDTSRTRPQPFLPDPWLDSMETRCGGS